MKHWINKYIIMVCSCLLGWSCSDEVLVQQSEIGKPVDVVLSFGATNNDQIEIKTRATYELYYESMVRNVYAFVFANGEKIYGHYFSAEDLNKTTQKEYWTVTNMTSDNTTDKTQGTLHMRVPSVSQGAEIVLIANIDLDFMNVSEERLGLVRNRDDLKELVVSLNQDIPDRNAGYFMMTGSQTGVTISSQGVITVPNNSIKLRRLDAKVEVNVRVDPSEETNRQKVEEFLPESWEVINLPKSSYLVPNNEPLQLSADSYYHLSPKNFETTENEMDGGNPTGAVLHGFSFYTLENIRSRENKKSVEGDYHHRDRRNKNINGLYNNENGMWEYAPELATYLKIKGELKMVVDPGATTEQHLIADVTYYVHLGDFGKDKDNYDVVRNTCYKYTINIKGVDKIETEVETSNDDIDGITESQPGAMGHLYEAEADTYTFDAHYGQRVYTIKASEVDTEQMTWYVRTPFGREGIPAKDETGKEIYNDLDYKWVEFMLNDKPESGNYSDGNQRYPADKSKLLTVVDVVKLIKDEVTAWKEGRDSKVDKNGELKFTVFVNEFYYEENPMNPNDPDILWKKFVNQPNRLMHILCKYNRSADEDSSVTGSILTIRQRSIQTPYNINLAKTTLTTGWGCETVDEMNNEAWFYHPDERLGTLTNSHKPSYTPHNTSRTNGLYNTACLLNLVIGNGESVNDTLSWGRFIDYTGSEIKLKSKYKAGLYSTLLRNRDLDGNGKIDPNELRWYIASLDQLCGLFLGDQGLSGDAQLYPIAASREPNTQITGGAFEGVYPWRLHVVSSTAWNQTPGALPTIVWAEEGASTGEYQVHWGKQGYSPIRCVRNLGMVNATSGNIKNIGNNYPSDPLVKVKRPTEEDINSSSVYHFDFTNMNEESRRYYTTRELVPGDEYSVMARLYDGFVTGALVNVGVNYSNNDGLKKRLESGGTFATDNNVGYRVPNVREGVAMYLYCTHDNFDWWYEVSGSGWNQTKTARGTMVSNYYSFGEFGNQYDREYNNNGTVKTRYYSWSAFYDRVTVGDQNNTYVRLVKDWNPGTGQ